VEGERFELVGWNKKSRTHPLYILRLRGEGGEEQPIFFVTREVNGKVMRERRERDTHTHTTCTHLTLKLNYYFFFGKTGFVDEREQTAQRESSCRECGLCFYIQCI